MRLLSSNGQAVSTFSGWSISQADGESLTKTVLTYLPPLPTPITEGNTIYKLFGSCASAYSWTDVYFHAPGVRQE